MDTLSLIALARSDLRPAAESVSMHRGIVMYKTTKEQCAMSIRGVCSQCGGPLEPIETVDNARDPTYWAGCMKCSRFCGGVEPKVFEAARKLVTEYHVRPYSHMRDDSPDFVEVQTGGATSLILQVLHAAKEVGLLPKGGS